MPSLSLKFKTKIIKIKYGIRRKIRLVFKRCRCPICGKWSWWHKKRRLNTRYYEDKFNYMISCEDCFMKSCDYYQELWDEYYSGIM